MRGRLTLLLALPVAMALAIIGGKLATPPVSASKLAQAPRPAPIHPAASWNIANDSP
jgi:hypothetical protein